MADPNASFIPDPTTFGTKGTLITPAAVDIDPVPKSVVLLTAGNVTVVPVGNLDAGALAFVGLAAGYVFPYRIRRVTAATATVASIDG